MLVDYSKGPLVWAQELELWREVGATDVSVRTSSRGAEHLGVAPAGLTDVDEHITALVRFIETVRTA